ncbi:MAG: M48 family metallopeptidase [Rhodospirillaceae bacterium]|nr:M48 family metallopeptidase [Rhodospirillaceae bacterium]
MLKRIIVLRALTVITAIYLGALITPPGTAAARGFSFVRDTEIENTIRVYTTPIFKAAGLQSSDVRIHLLNDPTLNAFVTGGQNIFINTGLLMRATGANQVIGVLAHETGHITGGHLARIQDNLRNATAQTIMTFVLGGLAAVASGQPGAAQAVIAGGAQVQRASVLSYTRSMEQNADQAAATFLDTAKISSKGLLDFLNVLSEQESLVAASQDPYVRSHPLTLDRIKFLQNHVAHSPNARTLSPEHLRIMHDRMRGKLKGFINPPHRTLNEFKPDDSAIGAKYARAVAFKRLHRIDEALAIMDALLAASPADPFFHELKGDILQDAGRIRDSITPYREAVRILPWAALIRTNLAQSLLELNEPDADDEALKNLSDAVRYEPEEPRTWRLLSTAYARHGDQGNVMLALAEEAMLRGRKPEAGDRAGRALALLPNGSSAWFRAQDIRNAARNAGPKGPSQ